MVSSNAASFATRMTLLAVFLLVAASAAAASTPYFITITLPAGDEPGGIAANPVTGRVYVVDGGSSTSAGTVWVIDGSTNKVTATISTEVKGFKAIAVNPVSNKIYVANQGAGSLTVIDGSKNTVLRTITVPGCPTGIDVNPYTNRLYVSSQCGDNKLYVIDGSTDTLMSSGITLGGVPATVAVDPINNQIYVRVGSGTAAFTEAFDGRTNTIVRTLAGLSAMSVDPYLTLLWGVTKDPGLTYVDLAGAAVSQATDVTITFAVTDSGTRRVYALTNEDSPTLIIADRDRVIDRLTKRPAAAAVAVPLAIIPEKRLFILNADRTVTALALTYDVLSLGSVTTTTTKATVPVYLKDAVGTLVGSDSTARFSLPGGLAIDNNGALLVADILNQTVRKITAAGVTSTIAGTPSSSRDGDGSLAAAAHFALPYGVAVNAAGDIYITDYFGNQVRKIAASTGIIGTVAGTGTDGFSGDGGSASFAALSHPTNLALDSAGNLYICDSGNFRVRRVDAVTGTITTVAGNGLSLGGDSGPATAVGISPAALAINAAGDLFIADFHNHVIRKLTASNGVISTFAGTLSNPGSSDGTGSQAQFSYPEGIAIDNSGNLFVADSSNHAIRKITSAGVVSTYAGVPGSAGAEDGASAAARFNTPFDVRVDSAGNVFVSDYYNSTIRKIDANGIVSTLAGVAGRTGTADGGPLPGIGGLEFIVYFSDRTKISGCSDAQAPNCQVGFSRSGSKAPNTLAFGHSADSFSLSASWISPPVFTSTNDPGDLIGNLTFTLSSTAVPGNEIGLSFDPSGTASSLAAFNANTTTESFPDLVYQNATITVAAPVCDVSPATAFFLLSYRGASSGCSSSDANSTCSAGETVSFTLTGRPYTFQSCDTLLWSFGDGSSLTTTGTTTTVSHAYAAGGMYSPKVTITNAANAAGTVITSKSLSVAAGAQCIVFCSASVPTVTSVNVATPFTGAITSNCTGSTTFEWDFGDGSTNAKTSTATHAYSNAGSYTWTLLVTSGSTSCFQSGIISVPGQRQRPVRH